MGSRGSRNRLMAGVVLAGLGVSAPGSQALEFTPRCFIDGGGTIDGDSFGGHAASYRKDSEVRGHWTHRTSDGRTLEGRVDELICRVERDPGHPSGEFSQMAFQGSGTFAGQAIRFHVNADDYGEPGDEDLYQIVISGPGSEIVYEIGRQLDGGNLQIHPANGGHP